jgi:hypothetical protein
LNGTIKRNTDVSTFHCYLSAKELECKIRELKEDGRPILCTEWLNRCRQSHVRDCLPIFKRENVGCLHWGLVNGRSQTDLCWGHRPGDPENELWQHDLYRPDLSPYAAEEIDLFQSIIGEPEAR